MYTIHHAVRHVVESVRLDLYVRIPAAVWVSDVVSHRDSIRRTISHPNTNHKPLWHAIKANVRQTPQTDRTDDWQVCMPGSDARICVVPV
jgi:hypothetical protein